MSVSFVKLCCRVIIFMCVSIVPCYSDSETESINCSRESIKGFESKLTNLRELNIDYGVSLCKKLLMLDDHDVTIDINYVLSDIYRTNKKEITGFFSNKDIKNKLGLYFDEAEIASLKGPYETKKLSSLNADPNFDDGSKTDFYFTEHNKITLPANDEQCNNIDGVKYDNCRQALKDISTAFNVHRSFYDDRVLTKNLILLKDMSHDWNRFINNARNQTLLDTWFTTAIFSGHYKSDHLVSPASKQLFLLHPGLVYEHFGDAPSGEKDKVSVSLEWLGINWWDTKIPFGVSVTSVYADRRDVSSTGTGLMFFFDNKYALGWTHRDEGSSFYISLDILKYFSDKKQQFEQYKSMF